MNRFYFLSFLLFFIVSTQAQNSKQSLHLKVFVAPNKILLRWAPSDKITWQLGNKYGHNIERLEEGSINTNSVQLNAQPIKPLNENDTTWRMLLKTEKNTPLVYQALYSKKKTTTKPSLDASTFGFVLLSCDLSIPLAKANGLFYEDNAINHSKTYVYKLSVLVPKTMKPIVCTLRVDASELTSLNKITSLNVKPKGKVIQITWDVTGLTNDYTGYTIERSIDSIHYVPINKTPYVYLTSKYTKQNTPALFVDTASTYDTPYYYRVRGISHFGELGPSSNIVTCKVYPEFTSTPIIDSIITSTNSTIKLKWHLPNYKPEYIKGYRVLKSTTVNGMYKPLNKTVLKEETLIDTLAIAANYYKVVAFNNQGDSSISNPVLGQLVDTISPTSPKHLKGFIDSTGRVTLTWDANNETDLKGYRVFSKNTTNEEFVEATKQYATKPLFIDTLPTNTLAKTILYTVSAVDNNYNNSKQSIPVTLKRPDKIPPVKAIFKTIYHTDSTVVVNWVNSTSKDVYKTELYRYTKTDTTKMRLFCPPDTITHIIDAGIENGKTYTYELIVYDDSNNKSYSKSPEITIETGVRKPVANIHAQLDYTKKQIILTWDVPKQDVYKLLIYKTKNNAPLRLYKTVTANETTFTDTQLSIGNVYNYAVKAIFNSGAESELSKTVNVTY